MGAALNLVLEYGRAPQGQRVYGEKPTSPGERIDAWGHFPYKGG